MADQMSEFVITTPQGEEFTITALDEKQATAVFQQYQSKNYTGPADKNGVPEGMVFDPATNRMVDAKALANNIDEGGSLAGTAMKGMPFAGEFADELAGYFSSSNDTKNHPNESQPIQTEVARQLQKSYEDQNPKKALAAKIGVGLTALPAALEMAPTIPATWGLAGRTAASTALGGTGGAVEGFVSGVGEGQDGNRLQSGLDRAKWSAATGAMLGAAAPAAGDALKAGARKILDKFTVNKQLADLGLSRPAADAVSGALKADDTLGQAGMMRLNKAGPDAMLADAGDTAAGLLDTTIQKSGTAGRIASSAVAKRASDAGTRLRGTMDIVLGKPAGIDKAARDIASKSSAARQSAYSAAYSKPIDYAASSGRQIESIFSRTPPSILKAAITEANDSMTAQGLRNMQILADVADDGSITFRQMPNMQQVDELKRALGAVAESSVDQFGRKTPAGLRAAKLARELRDAAVDAVPEYKQAITLGGDKIAEDNALRLGHELLNPSTTREDVANAVKGITDAERKQLALGLRQRIDDTMANVTQALSDTNMDAREAAKALKDLSSRAAREKLVMALGERKAVPLFKELERAQAAINLKSAVQTNSKTFARTEAARAIEDQGKDGVIWAAREGKPLEAGRRTWQTLTGATSDAVQARQAKIYEDISTLLTGPRGPAAAQALQRLEAAYKAGGLNKETARKIAEAVRGVSAQSTYQSATQR